MRLYKPLYMGKNAGKRRSFLLQGIRRGKLRPGAYVITPAANGNNILDIYPAAEFLLPYYRDQDFLILGIALGYFEALEVAGQIVDEMYRETGGFDLAEFLEGQATCFP